MLGRVGRSGFSWCHTESRFGKPAFALLKQMMKSRRRPVHRARDGLAARKKVIVCDDVAANNGKLTLHFLPGYAPDPNPDELAWSHL